MIQQMKKYILICFLFSLILSAYGQTKREKYIKTMEATIALMDSDDENTNLQDIANKFERIGDAEKKEWIPYYYAALCYNTMAYSQKEGAKIDATLDKAQELVDKAAAIKNDESEIWVLKGMILGGRIMVDPQVRGMQFGPAAGQAYSKAKSLNPNNPRASFFAAQNVYFTPAAFGGGKDKAMPMLKSAMESFDTFKPESSIHPKWGKEYATEFISTLEKNGKMPWEETQEDVDTDGE